MLAKLHTIRHSKGFQQSAVTVFGSLIAAAMSAVATLFITRRLGPEEFGVFSVGFAVVQILIRLCDFGMTTVVQRFASREQDHLAINRLFSYTTKVRLITWISLSLIGVIGGNLISQLLNFDHPGIITLAFIVSGATYFYEHFQAMLQSIHRFTQAAIVNIGQSVIKAVLSVAIFSFASVSTLATFSGYMVAPILPYFFFRRLFPSWVKFDLQSTYAQESRAVSSFALHSAISFVSAGIIENVDVLFVQRYMTTYEVGLLGGANKIALLFSIVAYALGNVLNARVSRYRSQQDMRSYLKKASLIILGSVLGFLAFVPFARITLLLTIGEKYLPALPILLLLVASSFLTIAVVPLIALFFSFNKPIYFSIAGITQLLIIIGGNMLFVPVFGLEAAAWSRVVTRLVLFILTAVMALITYRNTYEKNR